MKPWVLLVQGENLEETSSLLEKAGYRVLGCSRHNEAHRMMLNQKFSAVLIEYDLEDSTADQLIQSIKRNSQHLNHATPLILIKAEFDGSLIQRLGKNLTGALIKPFEPATLVQKLLQLCPPSAIEEAA